MRVSRFVFALLVFATFSQAAFAQTFDVTGYPAGNRNSVIVSDINHDGWPDFVFAGTLSGMDPGFSIALNQGNGTFAAPVVISTTAVNKLLVDDFNNDGSPDIARCNSKGVAIWLGDGKGHFTKATTTPMSCGVLQGDFNHDGKVDLAESVRVTDSIGNLTSTSVIVHLGNGAGGFSGTVTSTGLKPMSTSDPSRVNLLTLNAAADLNRDGFTDLVASDNCGGNCLDGHAGILLNDGTGHFKSYTRVEDAQIAVNRVFATDLNQDGWPDLIVEAQQDEPAILTLTTHLRRSDGTYPATFVYSQVLESGNSYSFRPPAFGDFDGDGVTDMVVAESHFQEGAPNNIDDIRLLLFADKSFTSVKSNTASNDSAMAVVSGDFNRDARPDYAHLMPPNIIVELNFTESFPPCSTATDPLRTVRFCLPLEGSTVNSPVRIVANAATGTPVSATKVYVDGVSKFITSDNWVNTFLPMSAGTHKVTVKAWDRLGSFSDSNTFTVLGGCTASTTNRTVKICAPANGTTVATPVRIQAIVTDSASVTVKLYVDGFAKITQTSKSIDTTMNLEPGPHKITVRAWDATGNFSATSSFTAN